MSDTSANLERLNFLEGVVTREAAYLTQTDRRLFSGEFGLAEVASLPHEPDLAERVDALQAAHGGVADLSAAASTLAARARGVAAPAV